MANKKLQLDRRVNIKNRRATFDYEILDRYTAGIVLVGSEISLSDWVRQAWQIAIASLPTESYGSKTCT